MISIVLLSILISETVLS